MLVATVSLAQMVRVKVVVVVARVNSLAAAEHALTTRSPLEALKSATASRVIVKLLPGGSR